MFYKLYTTVLFMCISLQITIIIADSALFPVRGRSHKVVLVAHRTSRLCYPWLLIAEHAEDITCQPALNKCPTSVALCGIWFRFRLIVRV